MPGLAHDPVVIVSAARTPIGSFQGALKDKSATDLGAIALRAALQRSGLASDQVDEVLMGCVLPAGLGQAPARQAALGAGLPQSVACTTVNKVCGSGMRTVMMAHDMLLAGSARIVAAGGMESMTNTPYLLEKARIGYRIGHGRILDHMFLDGLEDAYDKGRAMGTFAEDTAAHYDFSREMQDQYALQSLTLSREAIRTGAFAVEIAAVGDVSTDEQPSRARPEKISTLRPSFREGGTITAANSSSISDGAAALILMRRSEAEAKGITPLATVTGHSSHAQQPCWFTTAPVPAIQKLLARLDWALADVDLFEVNEAFAVVALAAMQQLDIPREKLNVNGGACALGHPIGCSGARIIVTLLSALRAKGLKRGIASLCIGGGEATALAVELV